MKNFKCTLLDQGIHIQGDADDLNGGFYPVSLLLSDEEADLPWAKAAEWAIEKGGTLPTRAQWQAIQAHRDEINAALEKAAKPTLDGWYWTSEERQLDNSCAWCVRMSNGHVSAGSKYLTGSVRAVSAFHFE